MPAGMRNAHRGSARTGPPAAAPPTVRNTGFTACDAESRQHQRGKQIWIGKATEGYRNYSQMVPREQRVAGVHPDTPPVSPRSNEKVSKRDFERMLRNWRKYLHRYDDDELSMAEDRHGSWRPVDRPVITCTTVPRDAEAAPWRCGDDGFWEPPVMHSGPSTEAADLISTLPGAFDFGPPVPPPRPGMGGGAEQGRGEIPPELCTLGHSPVPCGLGSERAVGFFWHECVSRQGAHNVRSGPWFDAPVLYTVPTGAHVLITEVIFRDGYIWGGLAPDSDEDAWVLVRDRHSVYMHFYQEDLPDAPPLSPRALRSPPLPDSGFCGGAEDWCCLPDGACGYSQSTGADYQSEVSAGAPQSGMPLLGQQEDLPPLKGPPAVVRHDPYKESHCTEGFAFPLAPAAGPSAAASAQPGELDFDGTPRSSLESIMSYLDWQG